MNRSEGEFELKEYIFNDLHVNIKVRFISCEVATRFRTS